MTWWCSVTGTPWTWEWRAYPGVWLFVLVLAGAYWWVTRRGVAREPGRGRRDAAALPGLALLWIALDWPVGPLGAAYLASVHTLQFFAVGVIVPALLLLGTPPAAWLRLASDRRRVRLLGALTHPVVAAVVFNLVVAFTHVPASLDALKASQAGAFGGDTAWLLGGLVFWWPVLAPVPARRGGAPVKLAYLFAATLFHTYLAMFLLLSRFAVYRTFELARAPWGLAATTDQAIAGGIMLTGGTLFVFTVAAVQFFAWARAEENGG